jgi:hypothetical protein
LTQIDAAAISVIGSTPAVLRALLEVLPQDVIDEPNEAGWSLKDVVAHLVDVEDGVMVERIERMLHEEQPFIESIDPPARLIESGYRKRELVELLSDLDNMRTRHIRWLEGLTADELARSGEHDTVGKIKVIDIAHQWAAHDMAHLRQVALMIQQHLAPLMGNTRAFYDV